MYVYLFKKNISIIFITSVLITDNINMISNSKKKKKQHIKHTKTYKDTNGLTLALNNVLFYYQ